MNFKENKYYRIKWLGIALLMLFIGYYISITLFSHTHVIDNVVISHSHPYSPGANHSHTSFEYQAIRGLSLLLFVILSAVAILHAVLINHIIGVNNTTLILIDKHFRIYSLRAPPAIS